ncbi:MAG: efflux RND transporter periplasmic adaptor subunit [Myxococcota bacterium]
MTWADVARSILAVGLAVALAGAGCGDKRDGSPRSEPSASEVGATVEPGGADIARSDTAAASITVLGTTASGSALSGDRDRGYVAVLVAAEAVEVAALHDGILVEVRVRPGDRVSAGQVVARLDEAPMREALAVARGEREAARATVAQREIEVSEAERALAVSERLVGSGVSAQKELDDARFAVDKARSVRAAARAVLAQEDARIAQLSRRLREAAITAPIAGRISLRYLGPGTVVSPGTAVVRLIRTDTMWIRFAVPPERAGLFAIGDTVSAAFESPPLTLPAVVRNIAPELDPAARMLFVEAEMAVPEQHSERLRAGLPAWVRPAAPGAGRP